MIIIEYKETYLAIDSNLYIYCLLIYFIILSNKHRKHLLTRLIMPSNKHRKYCGDIPLL